MGVPVLVLHGVGNRRREPFGEQVGRLQGRAGPDVELIPVFWGDLGAGSANFDPVLPDTDEGDGAESVTVGPGVLTAGEQAEIVAAAAEAQMGQESPLAPAPDGTGIQEAVREGLPRTTFLSTVQSPKVLAAVGQLVGKAAAPAIEADESEAPAFIGRLVHNVLSGADRLVGAVMGEVIGGVHHDLRSSLVPGVAGFLGDVFAYQHHRRLIQEAIFTEIDGHDSTRGMGTEDNPIHVVAHSLGGVIAFQAATAADTGRPLFIDSFVTFGSQAGFFHLLDPRDSGLPPFAPGTPVVVRKSIRRWTNLWEPLDPLAFLAGTVFALDDGAGGSQAPVDRPTSHLASSGLFTHGSYWESDELADAVRTIAG